MGTYIYNKINNEEDQKEQEKKLALLKQEVAEKNRIIQAQQIQDAQQKNGFTSTDSDNLLENANLYCPISNGLTIFLIILMV